MRKQLSASQFLTRDLCHIYQQTQSQLLVAHFQTEDSHRNAVINSHALHHGERKCRLSHGGTGGDDDEVTLLPSVGNVVQFLKSRGNTAHTILLGSCLVDALEHLRHYRIYLSIILLHVLLRDGKELGLCFLHEVLDIHSGVIGIGLDVAAESNELACQSLLRYHLGVIFNVGT